MGECPYYEVEEKIQRRNPISPDRQRGPGRHIQIAWCDHPNHSPVDRVTAMEVLGGGRLLMCQGSREECPLSAEKFDDV